MNRVYSDLRGKILASRQCMLAMELQDIERENFDGSLMDR